MLRPYFCEVDFPVTGHCVPIIPLSGRVERVHLCFTNILGFEIKRSQRPAYNLQGRISLGREHLAYARTADAEFVSKFCFADLFLAHGIDDRELEIHQRILCDDNFFRGHFSDVLSHR